MKKTKITIAITSALFSGFLYAADANASTDIIEFIPGTTSVENGVMVSYKGSCYIAKNNPGVWEAPTADSWFWDLATCEGDVTPEPTPNPNPNPTPNPEPTPDPEPTPTPTPTPDPSTPNGQVINYVPGQTPVKNGDIVLYQGECFIAQNNPGIWETPSSSQTWFWKATSCPDEPTEPNPDPELPKPTELSIVSPTAGQTIKAGETLSIQARIGGESATKVEFWAANTKLAEKAVNPNVNLYSQAWVATEAGHTSIRVIVLDKAGQTLQQQAVSITVTEETKPEMAAPKVAFVTPANGSSVQEGETVSISVKASDADDDLNRVVVQANAQQICEFTPSNNQDSLSCDWKAEKAGSVALKAIATDAEGLSSQANVAITVTAKETVEPPVTNPDGLCAEFNVYPNWTNGDHATGGDIMVHEGIAYTAIYWTQSIPGSDASWALHLNCDGSAPGAAPVVSLPNPMDPVRLEVAGWPNTFVVTTAPSASNILEINTANQADLANAEKLTKAFVDVINQAKQADAKSIIFNSDVLSASAEASITTAIPVKAALLDAVKITSTPLDVAQINALTDDLSGWTKAHQFITAELAPNALFGWTLAIGDFAYDQHTGRRAVWDAASAKAAEMLHELELYKADSTNKADFIAFTKSNATPALTSEQWHNALEFVKQVTDFAQAPAILSNIPTDQAATYFMGDANNERQLRKAAFSNVFALTFDKNSAELTSKIAAYQSAKVPLYYVGEKPEVGSLTSIAKLNEQLLGAEETMNNSAFLYETPTSGWVPSTVYKWADFMEGLNAMHNIGVAGNKFWLIDPNADDETNIKYAKVAIAAFLAQSMQETIRYNACDENNWAMVEYGAATDYPMSASCGQLGQKYADYGVNPNSGLDYAYSCPRNEKMEVSALTHAKWYGAPAPVFAAPDAVLAERGLLVNGSVGRWDHSAGHCNDVPETVDTSKQVWERDTCKIYEGQKAGAWIWDGSSKESVQGCGWWGRGVIQTTGRQNFGTLNHYLGRSHIDPTKIGTTIDGVTVEAPPANPLYSDLDFCSNPGLICSSEENAEIKWIAGLFYWVTSVQAYNDVGGQYADWNYYNELKKYVDGGMTGTAFIDSVSGIVNRGCPDSVCSTGEVHNMKERRDNFNLVLEKLGVNPR